tara:strand:+ start:1926 stop:3593 length:1668 start_codon:yes stop_codon:yes gene_type:complete
MNRNVNNKRKLIKSSKKNINLEKSRKLLPQKKKFTYNESYEPGSWETNNNNIYYDNCGGAVSVNTNNVQYFKPFSNYDVYQPQNPLQTDYGTSIATGNNGYLVCVSDISNHLIHLYTYDKNNNTWSENVEPISPDLSNYEPINSQFGFSIDMDEKYLVVGDPGLSTIYVYDFPNLADNQYNNNLDGKFTYMFDSEPLLPNLGYSCAISKRPETDSYAVISGSPNTNDVLWWDDSFKNWYDDDEPNSNTTIYDYANEYNGSNNTDIQAGSDVDIQWKDNDEYFFVTGAPNKNVFSVNEPINDAGEILVSYCNKTYNSIVQYSYLSQDISSNFYYGSNVAIDNECKYLFVSSPGAIRGNDENNEPISQSNGMIEAYLLDINEEGDFDISYKNVLSIPVNNAQIGNALNATSFTDNDDTTKCSVNFGAPTINLAFASNFDGNKFDSEPHTFIPPPAITSNVISNFGYSTNLSLFNSNPNQQLCAISCLDNPQMIIFNNVGNYQFNVNGDSYSKGNFFVNGELRGTTIDGLQLMILQMQAEINRLNNAVFEPESESEQA